MKGGAHVPVFSSANSMREQLEFAVRRLKLSDVLVGWVAAKGRMLCGAGGINMVLPDNLKTFLNEDAPAVFEVMTPAAEADAEDLRSVLRGHGYPAAVATSPLADVRSIIVEGARVAELTPIPADLYARLAKLSLTGEDNMRVAPVQYLRMVMLYDLSRPERSPTWQATFDLLLRTDRAFGAAAAGPEPPPNPAPDDAETRGLVLRAKAWLAKRPYIMCGYAAAAIALASSASASSRPARIDPRSTCMDVLAADPAAAAQDLADELKKHAPDAKRVAVKAFKATALVPRGHTVLVGGRPLAGVYHANQCFAFVRVDGIRVATIDTLLAMYLRAFLDGKNTENLSSLCDLLTQQLYRNLGSGVDDPSFRRFVTDCYGPRPR